MTGLTRRQRDCLLAIDDLTAEAGDVCPLCEELRDALGLRSKGNVSRLIDALEERGMIVRLRNRVRSIAITPAGRAYLDQLCADYEFTIAADVEWVAA